MDEAVHIVQGALKALAVLLVIALFFALCVSIAYGDHDGHVDHCPGGLYHSHTLPGHHSNGEQGEEVDESRHPYVHCHPGQSSEPVQEAPDAPVTAVSTPPPTPPSTPVVNPLSEWPAQVCTIEVYKLAKTPGYWNEHGQWIAAVFEAVLVKRVQRAC